MTRWACAWEAKGEASVRVGGVVLEASGWKAWMVSSDMSASGEHVVSQASFAIPPSDEDGAIRYVEDVLLPSFVNQGFGAVRLHRIGTDDPAEAIRILVEVGAHDVVKSLVLQREPHVPMDAQEVERLVGYVRRQPRDSAAAASRLARKRKSAKAKDDKAKPKDPFGASKWQPTKVPTRRNHR